MFLTCITPATPALPQMTPSMAMGAGDSTAMGGGIKLCVEIPTVVRNLLREPRNLEYMHKYRTVGVHEITLPHLSDPSTRSGLTGSLFTLHGTMEVNIPSILATGFRPSKASESVYGCSVCVTPDIREASRYQSFIAAIGELRSVREQFRSRMGKNLR